MATNADILAELHRMLDPVGRNDAKTAKELDRDLWLKLVPQVHCADGFQMSVQASSSHYCTPRDSVGPWSAVEVGFPSERVESFMPFADDADSPTDTVYGWVPIDLVAQAIADHGGFATHLAA